MVTVGKDQTGRPICKPLKPQSYFPTYNEAYAALVEYNRNPYDLDSSITLFELYQKWLPEYERTVKSAKYMESAWEYCSAIYDMRAKDVRARHIKGCMEDGIAVIRGKEQQPNAHMKSKIKSLFNMMLDYALEYEIVDRNYAKTFSLSDDVIKEMMKVDKNHIPFTDYEMERLWEHVDTVPYADVLLIQCYSGWRPQELGLIELRNVDLEKGRFQGGLKSEAGIERVVPIHPRIRRLVEKRYAEAENAGCKYLLNCLDDNRRDKRNTHLSYERYRAKFQSIVEQLELDPSHRPHDGRKHFVTEAKKYCVDEYAIKYIVGHAIDDITEKTYTQREFSWLQTEIEKIK